jgi:hypothetical protein
MELLRLHKILINNNKKNISKNQIQCLMISFMNLYRKSKKEKIKIKRSNLIIKLILRYKKIIQQKNYKSHIIKLIY